MSAIGYATIRVSADGQPLVGDGGCPVHHRGGKGNCICQRVFYDIEDAITSAEGLSLWREKGEIPQPLVAAVLVEDPRDLQYTIFWAPQWRILALLKPRDRSREAQASAEQAARQCDHPLVARPWKLVRLARRAGKPVPLASRLTQTPWYRRLQSPTASVCAPTAAVLGALALSANAAPLSVLGMSLPMLIVAGGLLLAAVCLARFLYELTLRTRYSYPPGESIRRQAVAPLGDPVYPVAVCGYRRWTVEANGFLMPVTGGPAWAKGRNVAHCNQEAHSAPGAGCDCGFNCYHWIAEAEENHHGEFMVSGAIIAGGAVRAHRDGFRSELAAPVALLYPRSLLPTARKRLLQERIRRAADRYGLPLVRTRRQLARVALATGAEPMTRAVCPPADRQTLITWLANSLPATYRRPALGAAAVVLIGLSGLLSTMPDPGGRPTLGVVLLGSMMAVTLIGVSAKVGQLGGYWLRNRS